VAGPVEAAALGNILVQAVATGHLAEMATGRQALVASEEQKIFEPRDSSDWDAALTSFMS
jgi:rhamnulokinase